MLLFYDGFCVHDKKKWVESNVEVSRKDWKTGTITHMHSNSFAIIKKKFKNKNKLPDLSDLQNIFW